MIARRLLRDDWWKVLAYTLILLLNLVATIAAFPTFQANYDKIVGVLPSFLSSVKRAILGAGSGGLPTFLAVNHLFKGANVLGAAAAIILALGTVVREVEIGTVGLLLSRPISRVRILLSFALVHALELVVPLLLVTALAPPLSSWLVDTELDGGPLLLGALHASLFTVTVYTIALLSAVLFSEQIKVAAVAGGICVVSFLLYFIETTRAYTLYNLSSFGLYIDLTQGKGLPWFEPIALLLIAAAMFGTTMAVFLRKDY